MSFEKLNAITKNTLVNSAANCGDLKKVSCGDYKKVSCGDYKKVSCGDL